MPRTYTAGELSLLAGDYNVKLRVEIRRPGVGSSWLDVSAYTGGRNFTDYARWSRQIDAPVMAGLLGFVRSISGVSIAPLDTSSALNSPGPLLAFGAGVRVSTACVAVGGTPISSDWKEVFLGRVDDPSWGGNDGAVEITISDLGAWLLDKQIETERQYGSSGGTAVETVMQSILNDNVSGPLGIITSGSATTAPTLYTPTSPGWNIKTYTQAKGVSVLDALRTLAAQIGWEVRYAYDSSNVYRLTFYVPPRSKVTADYTIGISAYYDVTQLVQTSQNVRTRVGGSYVDATTHVRTWRYSQSSSTLTDQYDVRYMEINEADSSNIDSATEMDKMVVAARSDLEYPYASHVIQRPYFWLADLHDLVAHPANAVHYTAQQTLALVDVSHELTRDTQETTLTTRGTVAGNYSDWIQMQAEADVASGNTDTLAPHMVPRPSEDGSTGTLVLILVDLKGAARLVEYAILAANTALPSMAAAIGAGGWSAAPAPAGSVYTLPTVSLIEKQPVTVAWRLWADIGNGWAVVDGNVERFALGGKPLAPDLKYTLGADGRLDVTVRGDTDTTHIAIAVTFDGPAGDSALDTAPNALTPANTLATGRAYTWQNARQLTLGQKFYVTAKAYNNNLPGATLDLKASPLVYQTDQWLGASTSGAAISVASVTATDKGVQVGAVTMNSQTVACEVYIRESNADPGLVNVARTGHAHALSPIIGNSPGFFVAGVAPSNWLLITFRAVDALNRVGQGEVNAVGLTGGQVTLRVQLTGTAPTTPPAPASMTVAAGTGSPPTTTAVLSVVMGADVTGYDRLRIYRDGAPWQDVVRTAAANGTQTINDDARTPGSTYNYAVYALNSTSGVTSTSAVTAAVTMPAATTVLVPAPSIYVEAYSRADVDSGAFRVTVTPAANTPAGVTWYLEHSTTSSSAGFTLYTSSTSTTMSDDGHTRTSSVVPHWLRVYGLAPNYSTTPNYSNVVQKNIPTASTVVFV